MLTIFSRHHVITDLVFRFNTRNIAVIVSLLYKSWGQIHQKNLITIANTALSSNTICKYKYLISEVYLIAYKYLPGVTLCTCSAHTYTHTWAHTHTQWPPHTHSGLQWNIQTVFFPFPFPGIFWETCSIFLFPLFSNTCISNFVIIISLAFKYIANT